jgi:hypothetical protein
MVKDELSVLSAFLAVAEDSAPARCTSIAAGADPGGMRFAVLING